ncbi:MAG: nucleotidyltransferase family protein [Oscillospiraceae bacterium]|nr:nucleotidyltransferase family protein [Oscillospiraceae bacterium]
MKAVIMAGGMGTRLRPVTGDRPKPMADILGKPIMEHIVLHLKDCGFDEICAALKYRAGDIIAHFGDGSRFGVRMEYRIEEEALGTAGAVKNCAAFCGDEDFLVISGDAACDFELNKLMEAHRRRGAAATIALHREPEPTRYGLALQDKEGLLRAFIEKPDWTRVVTDLVNTGIYILSPKVMELVPQGQETDFGRDIFPELLRRGEKILGLEMQGYWCDIGTPASYFRCCADAWEGTWRLPEPSQSALRAASSPRGGAKNLPLPMGEVPSLRGGEGDEGIHSLTIPVSDRAGVMGILSTELMELGADYSEGISVKTPRFEIRIQPAAELSALRLAVKGQDMEAAQELLELGKDAIEKLDG